MDTVFSKFVDMFNEPDAQWSSIYPDKPLTRCVILSGATESF